MAEAKAAFALGPVRYRCLACGRTHRSDAEESQECLRLLAERYGWKAHGEPAPPWPQCTPAFLFVQCLWTKRYAGSAFAASASRPLPRELLALDPRADVRGELERCRQEFAEKSRRLADEVWSAWRAIAEWQGELAGRRPPADAEVVARPSSFDGQREVEFYAVRPRVRCAVAPDVVEVSGMDLCQAIPVPRREDARRAVRRLVHVEYRADRFLAVLRMTVMVRVREYRTAGFVVYQERYGIQGKSRFVPLAPGADSERTLQELLSK